MFYDNMERVESLHVIIEHRNLHPRRQHHTLKYYGNVVCYGKRMKFWQTAKEVHSKSDTMLIF